MKAAEPTKVLAIDDDPDICFYIQEILERNNCVVAIAERGRDALRLLATEEFDVVMADVRLPDLDGVSILEQVRLSGSEIPFVLITGYSENEPIISSMRLGAADYLTKPFTPSDLEKSLRRALEQKKRLNWSRHLYKIAEHTEYTLHDKVQKILGLTTDVLDVHFGFVVRSTPDGQSITFCSDPTVGELDTITHAYQNHVVGELPHILQSVEPSFYHQDTVAWAAIPLRMNQKAQGALCFFRMEPRKIGPLEAMRSALQLTELCISRLLEAEENAVIIANQQSLLIASQGLSSLGALATSIVHEIADHLAIIAGRTIVAEKLLQADAVSSSSRIKGALNSIGTDVKRIDRIVKGVRTMVHNRDPSESLQLLQIQAVLDEALELFRCKIKSRSTRLDVADIPSHLFIRGDPTQLLQVFLILLNNSFDAIEGTVEEWIRVEAQCKDQSLHLVFVDSGPGIPAELQERIFVPFFMTKSAGKGLGVGLSLARKFVEAHQGRLWIDTQSPNTCFVVQFFYLLNVEGQAVVL
ncbi:MAG TPA: response regulator [Oligoflexus sp.]|uniref:hybrid sensor histidine kinase/response regulator n=1 Tax=Oligoflexus sp. TaxID=1971216 RepID=UPI002D35705D|nr:response regulator [Oligoflexus sp.]HYX36522.1 response regulator [Oligoflexus sp.]